MVLLPFPPSLSAPPSPPDFTPVKLEHDEQLDLGYMPLRDDFEKVYMCTYLPRTITLTAVKAGL